MRRELDAAQVEDRGCAGSRLPNAKPRAAAVTCPTFKLLKDPQILLFYFLNFAIQLTIYAATFWLPTIIRKMGHLTDFQVGLFNTIPWIIATIAMYIFAMLSMRFRHQQAWMAVALVIAACGLFASTTGKAILLLVAICFSAIGFKAASSLFWPIPQGYLDARVAAGVIALINSVGKSRRLLRARDFRLSSAAYGLGDGRTVCAALGCRIADRGGGLPHAQAPRRRHTGRS